MVERQVSVVEGQLTLPKIKNMKSRSFSKEVVLVATVSFESAV